MSAPSCDCGSTSFDKDDSRGHVVCTACGQVIVSPASSVALLVCCSVLIYSLQVLEENIIVSEVSFSELSGGGTVADGFNVGKTQARLNTRQRFGSARSAGGEPKETAIANGPLPHPYSISFRHKKILQIAHQMNIRQQYIDEAQRYYNLAIINDFTRGRRISSVAAACLYIVCRLRKIPKLLIDFSEALSVNALALEDPIELPIVDPVLYISSYAAKLDFDPASIMGVIHTATELASRMKRDWLHTGRRPSGICAACKMIIHYPISINEI
ncbi:transcription factor TFIIIB subunit brf1 [Nowakowskiella sp. JEL0078]|nr:transcription factor TFIIIB subunit brf1 [Nowakowskiella sp. JEL0078]